MLGYLKVKLGILQFIKQNNRVHVSFLKCAEFCFRKLNDLKYELNYTGGEQSKHLDKCTFILRLRKCLMNL